MMPVVRRLLLGLFWIVGCAAPNERLSPPVSPVVKQTPTLASGSVPAARRLSDSEVGRGVVLAKLNALAEWHVRTVRSGAQQWQAMNEVTTCPTMSQLLQELMVERSEPGLDPWGHPYRFVCSDVEVTVSSDGADGVPGTPDDITVPRLPVAP